MDRLIDRPSGDTGCDAKALSDRIYVHVNTVHYRLNEIADETQCDLRNLQDVLELEVAIRFATSRSERPRGCGEIGAAPAERSCCDPTTTAAPEVWLRRS